MFTDILWRFLILETFLVGASSNCYEHPQKRFCNNKFVLEVKYHGERNLTRVKVEIENVFKGNTNVLSNTDNRFNVELAGNYFLANGSSYFISGHNENGTIYSDFCMSHTYSNKTIQFYRRGLADLYKIGCDCIDQLSRSGVLRYLNCYWRYSFMAKLDGVCVWIDSIEAFRCLRAGPPWV